MFGVVNLDDSAARKMRLRAHDGPSALTHSDLTIIAAARLDDRENLCRKLELSNPLLHGDSKLILSAYRKWGIACLDHLRGDFAFALCDVRLGLLLCARDQMGISPFFYAHSDREFVFSDRLHALSEWPSLPCRDHPTAIADFLLFGFGNSPDPELTAIHPVRRLLAGHALTARWGDRLRVWRYWSPPLPQPEASLRNPEEYAQGLKEVLRVAVRDRVCGRAQKASVAMSGGLDSTSIAALARHEADCHAFTIVHDRLVRDPERRFAQIASDGLGIPTEFLIADEQRLFDGWTGPYFQNAEPHEALLLSLDIELLRSAATHSPVLLSGSGGDVVFNRPQGYWKRSLRKGLGSILNDVTQYARWMRRIPRMGIRTAIGKKIKPAQRSTPKFPGWMNPDLAHELGLRERWREWHGRPHTNSVHEELQNPYWGRYFEFYHPASSGIPVTVAYPLFDVRVIEFLSKVPEGPWSFEKILLRLAMKDEVPERVRLRPKTPLRDDPIRARLQRDWPLLSHVGSAAAAVDTYVSSQRMPRRPELLGSDYRMHLRCYCLAHWLAAKNVGLAAANW